MMGSQIVLRLAHKGQYSSVKELIQITIAISQLYRNMTTCGLDILHNPSVKLLGLIGR
jgi:hypothetical protein